MMGLSICGQCSSGAIRPTRVRASSMQRLQQGLARSASPLRSLFRHTHTTCTAAEATEAVTETVAEPRTSGRVSYRDNERSESRPAAAEGTDEEAERAPWQQSHPEFIERLRGRLILAPLTKGGNLPFRRLCLDFGGDVGMPTMSEMIYARQLIRAKNSQEKTRLRQAPNEHFYGVQIATNAIDEALKAAVMAEEAGASWIDLNCGCPIYDATRRGLGTRMLEKPSKLERLVSEVAAATALPMTVKIRTGQNASKINVHKVVAALERAGAAAVTIHGRSSEQRYTKSADWDLVGRTAQEFNVPIIGNGDILTIYEAKRRMDEHNCLAVMVGRGALITPWIFESWRTGQELLPTTEERVDIYRQFVGHMKAHFGDDAKGRQKAWYFLPWHFGWFNRYRPFPEALYGATSQERPLLGRRWGVADADMGESIADLTPLERLLRCQHDDAHEALASVFWDSADREDCMRALQGMATLQLPDWEAAILLGDSSGRDGEAVQG